MTVVDISPVDHRRVCNVSLLGAGRGGAASLEHIVAFAKKSTAHKIQVGYTDAVPGRADVLATRAQSQGLAAFAREADVRDLPGGATGIIISHLDDPLLTAELFAKNPDADVLGYYFALTADKRIILVCLNAAAGEMEERSGSALLSVALARHSAAGGSEFLFGDEAPAAIRLVEPSRRNLLGHNMTDIIDRL